MHYVYRNPRPQLTIELVKSADLGNCKHKSFFRVTSTRKLSFDALTSLYDLGFLGSGQAFTVLDQTEYTDTLICVAEDEFTGQPTGAPANNPYTGKPYDPIQSAYYVYLTETFCDSGD